MIRSLPARIALACGLVVASGAALRAEEGVAIKNLLGSMGIVPKEKEPIRYRERAPLVLPPKGTALREPMAGESYASANPDWPSDPDVMARRRRNALEQTPVTASEVRRMSDNNPRLTIDEIRSGRVAGEAEPRKAGWYRGDNSREALYMSPEQARAGMRREGEAEPAPEAEPRRRVLTEPPAGMRRSAQGGAVAKDYQVRVDQQERDANPFNWIRKQFSGAGDE